MRKTSIAFNGALIQALLSGQKTVTRLVMTDQPKQVWTQEYLNACAVSSQPITVLPSGVEIKESLIEQCPYGQVGDKIWVQERFNIFIHDEADDGVMPVDKLPTAKEYQDEDYWGRVRYSLIYEQSGDGKLWYADEKFLPASKMPRYASRLLLEITDVDIEKVQDITPEQAVAEGSYLDRCSCLPRKKDKTPMDALFSQTSCYIHGDEFKHLWNNTYRKKTSGYQWEHNPYVWVVRFKVIENKGE